MNSWLRSKALRATVKFWGQSFSRGHYPLIYQQAGKRFIYFITLQIISQGKRTQIVPAYCGFFCVSHMELSTSFYLSVTGFCKKSFLVFPDQLKVYLVYWFSFGRNKTRRRISNWTADIVWQPSSDYVSCDQFYPMRACRNYSVGSLNIYIKIVKFWGQSFSWGHYPRKGFIYFITLQLISQGKRM